MKKPVRFDTQLGRLSILAAEERFLEPARQFALESARREVPTGEMRALADRRVYWKGSALFGKAAVRYACKRALLFQPLPRMREFANLRWLRRHLFQAPRPIAAGVLWRGGLPVHQFLATEEVPHAIDLGRFLDARPAQDLRTGVLDEIAREVARMHSLGFVHHDLFLRNLLVVATAPHSRVWFVDAWAGGPRPNLRRPAYDLACLTRDAASRCTEDELRRLRSVYEEETRALALPARSALTSRTTPSRARG